MTDSASTELSVIKAEIADLENVVDTTESSDADESVATNLYSISSFGVDYPVDTLISRMEKELFYIPSFQRKYVWSQNQASRFVESLLLGLPVPGIFLFKESDSGKHLVIDGQQRLKSLAYFAKGTFKEKKFRLTGLKSEWQDKTYDGLDEADRARLGDAVIHATVFKQDLPESGMSSVYEVFERINTGGVKLSPQEIRSCILHGTFNDFLFDINKNTKWREMYGPESIRLKDIELLLRFISLLENSSKYERPMKKFLNDFMEQYRNADKGRLQNWRGIFVSAIETLHTALGRRAFRPERALNAAVFDAISVGLARRIRASKSTIDLAALAQNYDVLMENDLFKKAFTQATADTNSVADRVRLATEAFAGV